MELWQRGIITQKDTGGLNLEWGNKEATLELIRQMAMNEGLGGMIGQKALRAAEVIGRDSGHYLYSVKGTIHEGVNSRASRGTALAETTANRGYDHLRGRCNMEMYGLPPKVLEKIFGRPVASDFRSWEGKPWMAFWWQNFLTTVDALGNCKFSTIWIGPSHIGYKELAQTINAAIGWEITPPELMEIGERIWNVERMFAHREAGIGREGDRPPSFYYQPQKSEPLKGERIDPEDYERALDEYYQIRGWSREGVPTEEALVRLKLDREPSHQL
jgi:aldehyde:ferredoxin oxidoreductase